MGDETLADRIEENAGDPKHVEADGVVADQHPLPDQIEADRYLRSREAAEKPHRGLRFTKLIPPGAA